MNIDVGGLLDCTGQFYVRLVNVRVNGIERIS